MASERLCACRNSLLVTNPAPLGRLAFALYDERTSKLVTRGKVLSSCDLVIIKIYFTKPVVNIYHNIPGLLGKKPIITWNRYYLEARTQKVLRESSKLTGSTPKLPDLQSQVAFVPLIANPTAHTVRTGTLYPAITPKDSCTVRSISYRGIHPLISALYRLWRLFS